MNLFKVGQKVVHTGYSAIGLDSSRKGFYGRITNITNNYVEVLWMRDIWRDDLPVPLSQRYCIKKARSYLRPSLQLHEDSPIKLYLVLAVDGVEGEHIRNGKRPTKVHMCHTSAQLEAERLASTTGKAFYVLTTTELVNPPAKPSVVKL